MTRIRLPYVHEFTDRHGKPRHYFRRVGFKQVASPGVPGSSEFMEAYQAALERGARIEIGAKRSPPGTIAALVGAYLNSVGFKNLATETQRSVRNILERFREQYGDKHVVTLQRERVQKYVNDKSNTPSAARNFLKALRSVMSFAVELGMRADNPTLGVKLPKIKTIGFRTWREEDIAAFEAKHPVGSQARLAMALMLFTGQRRSDIVHMGRQHARNGAIEVRQRKTGTVLTIPIHDKLQTIIDATLASQLAFITTTQGKPFKAPPASATGLATVVERLDYPRGRQRTGFARLRVDALQKPDAARQRLWQLAVIRACPKCSDIARPPIKRGWRVKG